jgi:polar amino acid transport system substrate-binding protein
LTKTKSKHVLVMVDACFSSTIFKSSNLFYENDGSSAYYERVESLLSRQAITAGGLEPVPDGRETHSVFAKYILKFLEKNEKEALDASELFEMIKYPVAANTPNIPQFGHLQNTGHEGGQFVFRLEEEKLCDSPVYFEEGEIVEFNKDGGVLHAKTDFKNVRYEWSYNSELLDHEGADLPVQKPGMYGVTIITEDGDCSNSAIAEVTIVMPDIIVDILEGTDIEFTYKGTLNASVTGYDGELVYEWKKGNFVMSDASSVDVMESDDYTITIRLPDGREIGKATAKVVVKDRVYQVQLGDNMDRIAKKFFGNTDKIEFIYAANPEIKKGEVLRVGTKIVIPSDLTNDEIVIRLSVATSQAFAPFSHPDFYKGGMLTDIVGTVFSDMGQTIDVDYLPNNQVRGVTYSGRAEVGYPFTKNATDEMLFLYSDPLYSTLNVFFVNKDSEVEDMEATMKKRMRKGKYRKLIVAVPVGFTSDKLMEYYKDKMVLLKAMPSLEDCFNAMKAGEVDMVAAPQIAGLVAIQNAADLQRTDFNILDKSIETSTLHLVISKEHPNAEALINEFNEYLLKARNSGKISKIIDSHIDAIQSGTSRP